MSDLTLDGGGDFGGRPIRKCPAVIARPWSESVDDIGASGREFRIASVSMRRVLSSSYDKGRGEINFRSVDFMAFTAASHRPPK